MLHLGVYTSPTGALLADWSSRAEQPNVKNNRHGFAEFTAFIPMSVQQGWFWHDRQGVPHVAVTDNGFPVFEGRLEGVRLVTGGIEITALGYYRALSDRLYTALWSDDGLENWRLLKQSEVGNARPGLFELREEPDGLWIFPKAGVTSGSTTFGIMGYEPPDNGTRQLRAVSITYDFTDGSGGGAWELEVEHRDSSWGGAATVGAAVTATGTGTISGTFTDDRVTVRLRYNAAAAATPAAEGETVYARLTSIRVKTTTSSTLSADLIIPDLLALAPALSSSTALIQSPGVDLNTEIYEDARPSDILDRFCTLGDSTNRVWEAGVWEGQRLHFRPRGSAGRTWYVDLDAYDVERVLDELYNSVYATRQNASGQTRRTANNTDTFSIARNSLTREAVVNSQSTIAAQAQRERDVYLDDHADSIPAATITVDALYTSTGARMPVSRARSGDTVVIRNLPPTLSTTVDRVRSFVIDEVALDLDAGTAGLTPEAAPDRLETLLARREERATRWEGIKQPQTYRRVGRRRF